MLIESERLSEIKTKHLYNQNLILTHGEVNMKASIKFSNDKNRKFIREVS